MGVRQTRIFKVLLGPVLLVSSLAVLQYRARQRAEMGFGLVTF